MKYIQAYIFIMLHFIVFFYKLNASGNPVLSKSIDAIFPQDLLISWLLCHILAIPATFQSFSLLLNFLAITIISHYY